MSSERPWSLPVRLEEVPEAGRRVEIEADAATREALAKLAGVEGIERIVATFDLAREGSDGLKVTGRVVATVRQTCVVTLEPLTNRVEEAVDLTFSPGAAIPEENGERAVQAVDALVDGTVDLGALATEFLILGVDPYPRKPGAVFAAPQSGEAAVHPFAALAALKKKGGNVKD